MSPDDSCTHVHVSSVSIHRRNWIRGNRSSSRLAVSGEEDHDNSDHWEQWREPESGDEVTRLPRHQRPHTDRMVLRWNRGLAGGTTWADNNLRLRQLWHERIAEPLTTNR